MAIVIPIRSSRILQLKITLKGVKPPVWRRILVADDVKLPDLHKIIQTSMGWLNSHQHHFSDGTDFYAAPSDDDFLPVIDYGKIRLNKLLAEEKDKISYTYDFGDDWDHEIVLEKVLEREKDVLYPCCTGGRRHCPPEDCGGPWRYAEIISILEDASDPEHEDIKEWLGDDFDPDYFSADEVNEMLQTANYGCFDLFDEFD